MASFGGDILEVTFNHPTLGNGSFFPQSNQGNTLDPGGFRNSDDANMLSGDGELIVQKNRVRASMEVLCANDMNIRNDIEVYKGLAGSSVSADWTFTMSNGTVWGGSGIPVGDIAADTNASTFTVKVASGRFKKIVG